MKNNILNKLLLLLSVLFSIVLTGCDSGDIYPKEKTVNSSDVDVDASFLFTNIEAFPESYKIVFGSFNEDSTYPISSKMISKPSAGEKVEVSLADIPKEATYLALYLVQEYSNSKIYPFYTYSLEDAPQEDFEIPSQEINLAVFGRVQKQVLMQCTQCHGGSGFAAADLYLTEGRSYSDMVNVTALRNPDKKIVSPNNAQNSYLMDILKGEALQNQHSSLSSLKDDDVILVEQWIEDGAKNE